VVVVAVESIEFLRPLTAQRVNRIGDDATFECEVSKSNARATWLKDGMDLVPDKKYHMSVIGSIHRLTIHQVDSLDVADYAINIKGNRSVAHLDVEAKPQLLIDDLYKQPMKIKAGSSLVIEVPFTGSPQPKATWTVNGERVRGDSKRLTLDTIYNMASLCLGRAVRADAGHYVLSLENRLGSVSLDVHIIVLGESETTPHTHTPYVRSFSLSTNAILTRLL
jgi:hypothetical protein